MSGWMLARGRSNEVTLTEVTAAGVRCISLAGADSLYTTGDFLLVSEADGSEVQWLGKVTAVSAAGVTFSLALARSKNTGARLWRAASMLDLSGMGVLQDRRKLETGVVIERSLGGDFLAVKVAEPLETSLVSLFGLTPQNQQALLDWLRDETGWGMDAFTLIGPGGEMTVVRLSGEPIVQDSGKGTRLRMEIPTMAVGEGMFQ